MGYRHCCMPLLCLLSSAFERMGATKVGQVSSILYWTRSKGHSALYAHKVHSSWWHDINKPEQFGFLSKKLNTRLLLSLLIRSENQISPLYIDTPDYHQLYAWHILPLGVYAKHEASLLEETSAAARNYTNTKAFKLLTKDPESRLVINCENCCLFPMLKA